MKKSSARPLPTRINGFTLVELLVVIAIIAILASVIMSAGGTAMKAALRAKTYNLCSQIQSGASNYYTEYSVYPVPTNPAPVTGQDYYIDDKTPLTWSALLYGLCGNINPSTGSPTTPSVPTGAVANNRGIAFLNLKSSDVDGNNSPLNSLPPSTTELYLFIVLDNDYDNVIGDTAPGNPVPNFNSSTMGSMKNYAAGSGPSGGVAVWANCNATTAAASQNPSFYVRTY